MRRSRIRPAPGPRPGTARRPPRTSPGAGAAPRRAASGRRIPAPGAAAPARRGRRRPPPHRQAGRCAPAAWPWLLEVVQEELREQVLLAVLLVLTVFLCAGRLLVPGRLRDASRAAKGVGVGEEPLLHLVGGLPQDDGLAVVLGPHLLERVEGLHLLQEPLDVLAGLHLDEADRAGELERLLLAEQREHVPLQLDAALVGPLVEHVLRHEEVVGHRATLRAQRHLMAEVSLGGIAARGGSRQSICPAGTPGSGCAGAVGRADSAFWADKERGAMASADVLTLTDDNFQAEVLGSETPVLVDFWAAWCGPCRAIAPAVEELARQYKGKLKVGKLDIDAHQNVPQKYGIMSIPTLILFNNGQVAEQVVGAVPKSKLEAVVKNALPAT